ncbi:MAG: hypothetical protein J2P36_14575, partial [Ktedonobacteraceae bacterium]|nr:hypothetical protein [Ktedonobacteraceae bacterium]
LLFTVTPAHAQTVIEAIQSETGTPVSIIGSMHAASEGLTLRHAGGDITPLEIASWDHLQPGQEIG